jgi:hypothetical protein
VRALVEFAQRQEQADRNEAALAAYQWALALALTNSDVGRQLTALLSQRQGSTGR